MAVEWKYRGRVITAEDIAFLRQFLAEHSGLSRRKLSAKVCEAWEWKQANGALCDMVCRGLMLMLHRAGEIELPPVRFLARNPLVERARPTPVLIDTTPVVASVNELRPVEVQQVRRTGDEPLFNSLLEQHHYLGYSGRFLTALGGSGCARSASLWHHSSSSKYRACFGTQPKKTAVNEGSLPPAAAEDWASRYEQLRKDVLSQGVGSVKNHVHVRAILCGLDINHRHVDYGDFCARACADVLRCTGSHC